MISGSVAGYFDKNNKSSYKKESWLLWGTIVGISADYSGYLSAQKYQDQGESKSKAYAKGGLVALGVFVVVLYVTLLGHAIYVEKIKKKY